MFLQCLALRCFKANWSHLAAPHINWSLATPTTFPKTVLFIFQPLLLLMYSLCHSCTHFALEALRVELLYSSDTSDSNPAHLEVNRWCSRTHVPWVLAVKQSRGWSGPPEDGACGLRWLDVLWLCQAGAMASASPKSRIRWVCRLVAFRLFIKTWISVEIFPLFFFPYVSIEPDNKEERMWKVWLDFTQCLWPGYKRCDSSTTALEWDQSWISPYPPWQKLIFPHYRLIQMGPRAGLEPPWDME